MRRTRRRFLQASMLGLVGLAAGCTRHEMPAFQAPARRVAPPPVTDEVRLALIGDWGCGRLEQWQVAQGCEAAAREVGGYHAGVMLGDNFYFWGVDSAQDPLWREYFEEPYDTEHLGALTWHAILGNHDHMGNAEAQIDYTARSNGRWHMPHYFYRHDFTNRDGETLLTMLCIDTDRAMPQWDAQLEFMSSNIEALRGRPFIICGHHPVLSNGDHGMSREVRLRAKPLIEQSGALAYFAGHDHNLQMIERPGMRYVISGGGGKSLHLMTKNLPGTLYKQRAYGFCGLTVSRSSARFEFRDMRGHKRFEHEVDI